MKSQAYNFLNNLITFILIAVAALTPLIFLNLTTDFYDMPKLIFLVVATVILLGLWIFSWIVQGKIDITRTPLDIPLLFLLITILASTFFSTSKYSSIYGVFPEVHGSAVSWVTYIILYFIAVSHLRKTQHIKLFLQVLFGSATIISLVSLFSYFQIFLPFGMARNTNFTPTGSTFSAVSLLLMLLPLSFISIVNRNKLLPQALAVFLSTIFCVVIVLIGPISSYIVLLFVFAACLFIVKNHLSSKTLLFFLTPFAAALLILMFAHMPFPGNKLNEIRSNFLQEIQLPFSVSWKVSATAFRDAPFVGTGPATFLFNFTSYKPVEFNQLEFWNLSFGTAYNEFLQVLGTWGLFGVAALISICAVILIYSKKYLFPNHSDTSQDGMQVFLSGLAVSGVVALALLLIHATTLVSVVITFFLMACFMMSQKEIHEKISEFSIGVRISTSDNKQIDFLPIVLFILFIVAAAFVGRKTYRAVAADYYHRLALSQANKDGAKTYEYLQKAENLNPFIDLYRVDMAQTNFALANALASQKGPTKDNPKGSLTDADKQTIQTLVTQAINEGRASVVISPRSSRNWEVLALIYRNITGVAKNSLTFALDAYGRSIQMDPVNPTLRINVGSIYYTNKNYDLAVRFYSDAINLKPDYLNGYYNLSLALKEKGDLQNAKLIAEQAVALLQKDLGSRKYITAPEQVKQTKAKDLNTISELLNGIKAEIDASTKTEAGEAKSGETEALQNPGLPSINVPDLNNPPSTTLPPAVEENPKAALPELNPQVSPTPAP
jgi:tetratricopeptide (TPR) repeat protein